MKQITITGNLGRSASEKEFNGRSYYAFSIAINGGKKDAPAEWVNVLYPKFSDTLGDFLKSGTKVLVIGRNVVRAYIDKNGSARASETVWADNLEIVKFPEPSDNEGAGDDLPL